MLRDTLTIKMAENTKHLDTLSAVLILFPGHSFFSTLLLENVVYAFALQRLFHCAQLNMRVCVDVRAIFCNEFTPKPKVFCIWKMKFDI